MAATTMTHDRPLEILAEQNFVAWKAAVSTLYCTGAITCGIRLYQRRKLRDVWVDDWIAIALPIFAGMSAVVVWPVYPEEDVYINIEVAKSLYWLMASLWVSCVWLSRIGLALALGRTTTIDLSRKSALSLASGFGIGFLITAMLLALSECNHQSRVLASVRSVGFCNSDRKEFVIGTIVVSYVCEAVLMIMPPIIRKFIPSLTRSQNFCLGSVTFVSAVTMLLTSFYTWFYFSPLIQGSSSLVIDMVSHLEAAFCVIAFNVPSLLASSLPRADETELTARAMNRASIVVALDLTDSERGAKEVEAKVDNDDASSFVGSMVSTSADHDGKRYV